MVFVESANLSMVERKLGNFDAAEALSREALRIVVAKNDQMAIPWVINGLAAVIAARGRLEPAATLIAMFPAVNGYFLIPNYGTIIAAINFDRSGTTRIGKFVINQSDRLFLAKMVSVEEMGIYSVGYQVGTIVLILVTAFSNFFSPFLFPNYPFLSDL